MNNNEVVTRTKLWIENELKELTESQGRDLIHQFELELPEGLDVDREGAAGVIFDAIVFWHTQGVDIMQLVAEIVKRKEKSQDGRRRARD